MGLGTQLFQLAHIAHYATLWLLLILSVLSIAFILERTLFYKKIQKHQKKFDEAITQALETQNLEKLNQFASKNESYESDMYQLAQKFIQNQDPSKLDHYFDTYKSSIRSSLDRFLNPLASIGSNAPFIGLLGTVFGVMEAFRSLAMSQGEPAAVMAGISQALIATAIGLFVAIPATFAYNIFQKKLRRTINNLNVLKDISLSLGKTKSGDLN